MFQILGHRSHDSPVSPARMVRLPSRGIPIHNFNRLPTVNGCHRASCGVGGASRGAMLGSPDHAKFRT
eukprot:3698922-Prymnesium_polylepis.1